MRTALRTLAIVAAALALLFMAVPATAQGRHGGGGAWGHHGGHGHGGHHWAPFWGGVGIGIGLGYYYDPWWRPYPGYPGYVVVESPPVAYYAVPPAPAAPDPVFYPRNGQSAAQTEADRQACNRWATTQPAAMADASVFHRATLACMDGRGYTVR